MCRTLAGRASSVGIGSGPMVTEGPDIDFEEGLRGRSGFAVMDGCKDSAGVGEMIGVLREMADGGGAGAGSATGGSGIAADTVRSIDSGCG